MLRKASVSDLVVDSFVKDSRQQSEPKENDEFTFFPDIIDKSSFADDDDFGICGPNDSPIDVNTGMLVDIPTHSETPHTITIPDTTTSSSGGDPPSPVWDWGDGDMNDTFDEASFLEILGNAEDMANGIQRNCEGKLNTSRLGLKVDSLTSGSLTQINHLNGAGMNANPAVAAAAVVASNMKVGGIAWGGVSGGGGPVKQKAPKKRMLEISASASLKAEAVAKSKELVLQAKREMAKRTRIRRKKPKKRRVVVEQKLVELIRMIRMCKRVKDHTTDLFERTTDESGSGAVQSIRSISSYKMRVVSLAIEAFLNSFMFVQPSEHEYIFQLVRPISESCTLSIPALSSLVTEAKNVLPFINATCPGLVFNSLPPSVPSKFYGFSEILKASEIYGDVIRFLLNSSMHLCPEQSLTGDTPPAFLTSLSHSNAAVSLINDRITVPFVWKSTGLAKNMELRGMVSCKITNELVVSIILHFDPFSVIRQSVPIACDALLKSEGKGGFNPLYFGF